MSNGFRSGQASRRAARQHRNREKPGPDDAQGKDSECKFASNRFKSFRRRGQSLTLGNPLLVQCQRRRNHDAKGDDAGKRHLGVAVLLDTRQVLGYLFRVQPKRSSLWPAIVVAHCLSRLPKKPGGADGRAPHHCRHRGDVFDRSVFQEERPGIKEFRNCHLGRSCRAPIWMMRKGT